MSNFRRISRLFPLLLVAGFLWSGCEDDPILTPGNDDKPAGGSYGRIDKVGLYPPSDSTSPPVMANPDENPALF